MRSRFRSLTLLITFFLSLCATPRAFSQINVTTQDYDNRRDGANTQEVSLKPAVTNATDFGKLFSLPVVGLVYAQPLYLAHVTIPNKGVYNVLYICTLSNNVYAFNADGSDPTGATLLWQASLGALVSGVPGVVSTPVIDPKGGTLYVVTAKPSGSSHVYQLHALDVATGAEKFGGPVTVQGSVPGTGPNSVAGVVPFNPSVQAQRPALTLAGGQVFIGFGATNEPAPDAQHQWLGWLFSYNGTNLDQSGLLCFAPSGNYSRTSDPNSGVDGEATGASLWNSGRGLAADAVGNLYGETGNGYFDADTGGMNYGSCVVKITLQAGGLHVIDWFAPWNVQSNIDNDLDMGSSSPILIPNMDLMIANDKGGRTYLLHQSSLGHDSGMTGDPQVPEEWSTPSPHFAAQAYWNGFFYEWNGADPLSGYALANGQFATTPVTENTTVTNIKASSRSDDPYNTICVSSDGSASGTGILWGVSNSTPGPESTLTYTPVLHAFNAMDLTREVWNSELNPSPDAVPGALAKWVPPVVANGKAFVVSQVTAANGASVSVYGLNPPSLLSERKAVTVTSGTNPAAAVDSNAATEWVSESRPTTQQSLMVDLGKTQAISRVFLAWDRSNFGTTYQLQVSNDSATWTTFYTGKPNETRWIDLPGLSLSGRYVRMTGTAYAGTGYAIAELQVYGPIAAPSAVTLVSPTAGDAFYAGRPVTLGVSTGLPGIAKVDFYAGATHLGTVTAAPYTLAWSSPAAGSYALTVVATTTSAHTYSSSAVPITVQ